MMGNQQARMAPLSMEATGQEEEEEEEEGEVVVEEEKGNDNLSRSFSQYKGLLYWYNTRRK